MLHLRQQSGLVSSSHWRQYKTICMQPHVCMHAHADMHACTHSRAHACVHVHVCIQTHTHTHTLMHACTCIHAHIFSLSFLCTDTHKHTHTYTHIPQRERERQERSVQVSVLPFRLYNHVAFSQGLLIRGLSWHCRLLPGGRWDYNAAAGAWEQGAPSHGAEAQSGNHAI